MRILIAASIYPPDAGGPAIHAKRQFEWLQEHGVDARVVALAHYRHLPKIIRHWTYLAVLGARSFGASVIYAHDAVGSGLPAAIVSKIFNLKLIIRVGGDLAWERAVGDSGISLLEWYESGAYRENYFYKLSLRSLKEADRIIVPTPILAEIYQKYYGIPAERFQIIPNPVPEVPKQAIEVEQKIVFASRLVGYKNLALVLRALVQIFPSHPALRFVIMGDGPERGNLEKLSGELGISNQVIFRGQVPQEEVLRETASCLFTLAPAVTEFNPNYVLQGLAYGKPFIITHGHGLPFSVPESLTFPYSDEAELVSRLKYLLTTEGYAEAQNFVQHLDFRMTWEENLEANLKLINQVIMGQ